METAVILALYRDNHAYHLRGLAFLTIIGPYGVRIGVDQPHLEFYAVVRFAFRRFWLVEFRLRSATDDFCVCYCIGGGPGDACRSVVPRPSTCAKKLSPIGNRFCAIFCSRCLRPRHHNSE